MDKIDLLPQDDVLAAEVSARPRAEREQPLDLLEVMKAAVAACYCHAGGFDDGELAEQPCPVCDILRPAIAAEEARLAGVLRRIRRSVAPSIKSWEGESDLGAIIPESSDDTQVINVDDLLREDEP